MDEDDGGDNFVLFALLCRDDVSEWWGGAGGWNGDRPNGFDDGWRNDGGNGGGRKLAGLVGEEKISPLLNGCGDSRDGGVDNGSLFFDFDVFEVNEDRNDGGNEGDERDFGDDGVWIIELNVGEFSSILIDVLELDKSIGIVDTVCSTLFVVVVVAVDDSIVFSWINGGGLDDAVLVPLVVGLILRLEQLSPVSSSIPFRTRVFSPDIELVSSSSLILVDDDDAAPLPVSWILSVERLSSIFDGGASGILNGSDLDDDDDDVTVEYVPRRLPFLNILSAGSIDEWLVFDCTWTDDWDVVDEVRR